MMADANEGIRCMVVDKGTTPNWSYKNISDVPQEEVQKIFEKLESDSEIAA